MTTKNVPISRLYSAYMDSWERFLNARGELPASRRSDSYWWLTEVGRSGVHIAIAIKTQTREPVDLVGIRVELCFVKVKLGDDARRLFEQIKSRKDEWEASLGTPLDWSSHTHNQYQVGVNIECDPFDRDDWPRQHEKALEWFRRFRAHFDTTT